MPAGLAVQVVLDNSSTHETPPIHDWLLKHFTPTSRPEHAPPGHAVQSRPVRADRSEQIGERTFEAGDPVLQLSDTRSEFDSGPLGRVRQRRR